MFTPEDRWPDIDLPFGVTEGEPVGPVVEEWTHHMYGRYGAVHHTEIRAGAWGYRAFLLAGTLPVNLAFAPAGEFRALAPSFRLVWGESREAQY